MIGDLGFTNASPVRDFESNVEGTLEFGRALELRLVAASYTLVLLFDQLAKLGGVDAILPTVPGI